MVYKSISYFTQGIGEKRATYILELREESPEPFKRVRILKHNSWFCNTEKRIIVVMIVIKILIYFINFYSA